jgi:hypothetical protein
MGMMVVFEKQVQRQYHSEDDVGVAAEAGDALNRRRMSERDASKGRREVVEKRMETGEEGLSLMGSRVKVGYETR